MSEPLPHFRKYIIKVQTWSVTEVTVEVEASSDRYAREKALAMKSSPSVEARTKGHITKNKTTILERT